MTPPDLHANAKLLKKLERYATPIIGVMGISAGSSLLGFATFMWLVGYERTALGFVFSAAGLVTVGIACLMGAWVKARAKRKHTKPVRDAKLKASIEGAHLPKAETAIGDGEGSRIERPMLEEKAW